VHVYSTLHTCQHRSCAHMPIARKQAHSPSNPPHRAHNITHVQVVVVVLQAHQAQAQVVVVDRPPLLLLPLVRASRHVQQCKHA